MAASKVMEDDLITCPVRIFYEKAGAKFVLRLGEDWRVKPSKALVEKLKALEECILVEVHYDA